MEKTNNQIHLATFNGGNFPKTISELDNWPVNEEQILVDLHTSARINHVTGSMFQEAFDVQYSYTTLTNRLKARGWTYETWTKAPTPSGSDTTATNTDTGIFIIDNLPRSQRTRANLSLSIAARDEWQQFLNEKCCKNDYIRYLNEAALREFIKKYKDKHIRFCTM